MWDDTWKYDNRSGRDAAEINFLYVLERVIELGLYTGLSFCSRLGLANGAASSMTMSSDGDLVVVHGVGQVGLDDVSLADFNSGGIF